MIEGLQHQLAPAALAGRGPQALRPVHDPGDDAVVVEAEPAAAGQLVEAGDDLGPVGPMAAGRQPGALAISSRLAPRMTGQSWPGRRRMTTLHMDEGDLRFQIQG